MLDFNSILEYSCTVCYLNNTNTNTNTTTTTTTNNNNNNNNGFFRPLDFIQLINT